MFPVFWILFPVLISSRTISMPLLDDLKATLKADVDVTEMNKYLQVYIQEEVKKGVANALGTLVEDIVGNKTVEAELRMTEKLQEEVKKLIQERQQYAFFATISFNKKDLLKDSVLVFDQVSLNVGEAYDETTGKFTCKVDGLYTFSWTTVSNAKKDFTSVLITSGRRVAGQVVDNEKTPDALSSSSTVIVRMRKGEQTWISVVEGDYLMATWSTLQLSISMFSGFKIN